VARTPAPRGFGRTIGSTKIGTDSLSARGTKRMSDSTARAAALNDRQPHRRHRPAALAAYQLIEAHWGDRVRRLPMSARHARNTERLRSGPCSRECKSPAIWSLRSRVEAVLAMLTPAPV
jgi:hypothetical protein